MSWLAAGAVAAASLGLNAVIGGSGGPVAQAKTVIQVTNWAGTEEAALTQECLNEFMKLHPDIQVKYEPLADYTAELLVRMATGTAPDVVLLDSPYVPAFFDQGLIEDLRPYANQGKVDLSAYPPNVLKIFSRGDKVYGLPKGYTPVVMAFNRRFIDEAGVKEPKQGWTYDDYLNLAKKMTRDTNGDGKLDRWGTYFSNWIGYWVPMLWSWGGDILGQNGRKAGGYIDSDKTVEGLQFMLDLAFRYRVAPTQSEMDAIQGGIMSTGRAGLAPIGHWSMMVFAPLIKDGKVDIGVVDLPKGPGQANPTTVIYAAAWGVTSQSKNKAEALEVAKFLAGPYSEEKATLGHYLELPGRLDTTQKVIESDPFNVEKAFLAAARYGRAPWGSIVPNYQQVEPIAADAVTNAWINGKNLKNELVNAGIRIDALLKKIFG